MLNEADLVTDHENYVIYSNIYLQSHVCNNLGNVRGIAYQSKPLSNKISLSLLMFRESPEKLRKDVGQWRFLQHVYNTF